MDPILEQFLSEARDNLSYLDSHLKELENGDEEIVNSLFRAAHTLKGGAGLVGLTHVKEITHAAEDLLDAYRNKKIDYSQEMLDTLYDAFDEVIELIDSAEESGSVEIEIDEEHIDNIKRSIRSFLEGEGEVQSEDTIEVPFALDENISLDNLTISQLERLIEFVQKEPKIQKESSYWIIDLNLSEDTIELGNDPFYLLSLLESDNILAVSTIVYNPEQYEDPLLLKTRMKVVCKSDIETLEDVFYNILDEISAYPLTVKSLLSTDLESIPNNTFDTLISEIENDGIDEIIPRLKAAINVINPETKEGFIVDRLLNIAKVKPDKLNLFLEELDIKVKEKDDTDISNEQSSNEINLSEKEIESTLNILKSQQKAIEDAGAFERVKFILKSVASFLGVQKSEINDIDNVEELSEFISKMISTLSGDKVDSVRKIENNIKEEVKEEKKTEKNEVKNDKKTQQKTEAKEKKQHTSVPKTVKIDQEEIDALMDIVGEILVIKNSLPYVANSLNSENILSTKRELLSKYEEISRITDQLQDRVMGMRLLPISYIFNRYPKLVRDISKKLNKKIEYKEYGSETKLDKMMIEKLADPLVHIIRNSLDHGLESPEERLEAGKNETGILTIGAKSEGDRVFIEISDDGRGIDIDKVVNIAMQKRLIDSEKIDNMSESEKLGLIFLPGLSTKEEITDLSGRGVGTDAVKTTVTELGGKIDIKSEKGKGTTIILELPVSVALTNLFQVKMANENYAIAMESVIETDKITKNEIQTANHKPFIKLRDSIIPLVLNSTLLKRDNFKDEENIIIVKVADTQIALVADELVGQIDVVQKPLSGVLKGHPYINGTSLLGNGEPLFVIKPEKLFKVV